MATDATIASYADEILTVSSMDVGLMWDRMRGEFLAEYARLQRTGMSLDDMADSLDAFIDGLSDKPMADMARKSSSVAYNQGRNAEIQEAAASGTASMVVRSEVLDTNTCDACMRLDGEVFEVDTPDYYAYMPPAECAGGDRCRGFYIVIPDDVGGGQ